MLRAIDAALEQQLRVKINCVPCVEMNGEDMEGIAALAADRPVDVRFIELMPIGCGKDYTGISSKEILSRLERVRLTCEGRLKLCLHYDRGLELKPLLRSGALDEEIRERILAAVREKPSEHHFREKAADGGLTDGAEEQRKMVQIGG